MIFNGILTKFYATIISIITIDFINKDKKRSPFLKGISLIKIFDSFGSMKQPELIAVSNNHASSIITPWITLPSSPQANRSA